MKIDPSLNQTVTITARSGFTNGIPTYGTAVSVSARVEPMQKMVLGRDGAMHESHARVFLPAGTVVLDDAKITLPDTSAPDILEVKHCYGRTSEHHLEVIL